MRLPIMVEQVIMMVENNELYTLPVEDILDRLTANEIMTRKNNSIEKLKKKAGLTQITANMNDLDYSPERKLNQSIISQLTTNDYIRKHRNIVIMGACGTGKSYMCNALGAHACNELYSVLYCRTFEFIDDLNYNMDDIERVLKKYTKPDVLILDDFLISEVNKKEAENLFKVLEYRNNTKSTIICSQLEPKEWHKNLGGSIMADSIVDRILPKAYTLILSGDSMRKTKQ